MTVSSWDRKKIAGQETRSIQHISYLTQLIRENVWSLCVTDKILWPIGQEFVIDTLPLNLTGNHGK